MELSAILAEVMINPTKKHIVVILIYGIKLLLNKFKNKGEGVIAMIPIRIEHVKKSTSINLLNENFLEYLLVIKGAIIIENIIIICIKPY